MISRISPLKECAPTMSASCPSPAAAPEPFNDSQPHLSRAEAARYLRISTQTLAAWAYSKRVTIPYAKFGRRVVYRKIDLDRFIEAN
jgi:excisionase family DNA binding protein